MPTSPGPGLSHFAGGSDGSTSPFYFLVRLDRGGIMYVNRHRLDFQLPITKLLLFAPLIQLIFKLL